MRITTIQHHGGSDQEFTTIVTFSTIGGTTRRRRYKLAAMGEFVTGGEAEPWMFETGEELPLADHRDVHTEHCCVVHGCKYGDDDCTVATGLLVQSFPCESCSWDLDRRLEEMEEHLGPFIQWLLATRGVDVNWAGDEYGPRTGRLPSALEEYRKYLEGTRNQVPQAIASNAGREPRE